MILPPPGLFRRVFLCLIRTRIPVSFFQIEMSLVPYY